MILSCVCAWYRQMLKMFKGVIYVKRDAVPLTNFILNCSNSCHQGHQVIKNSPGVELPANNSTGYKPCQKLKQDGSLYHFFFFFSLYLINKDTTQRILNWMSRDLGSYINSAITLFCGFSTIFSLKALFPSTKNMDKNAIVTELQVKAL